MLASDLAESVPTATLDTTGSEAVRIVAEHRLSALAVMGRDGLPVALLPGSQLLALVIPPYVRDDPQLAHVFSEVAAEDLCGRLATTTIGGLIDEGLVSLKHLPSVEPEDTILEIATAMVHHHCPQVLVRSRDGALIGVVTLSRVLAVIATLAGEDSPGLRARLEVDLLDPGAAKQGMP
ncbi:MAG: CBS domain-containing protein [Dermatophilaceae bacterium]